MTKRVFKYIAVLSFLSGYPSLFSAEIAKYAGEFMSTGVGARALAMGGAYVAVGGDVLFGYWNPAGLASIRYPEVSAMHSRRFGGVVNYDYGGFATPFKSSSSLALSFIRLAVDDIPITALPRPDLDLNAIYEDENGQSLPNRPYVEKTVNDAEWAFYLSYAAMKKSSFAYGANVKFVRKGVGDNSAWGIGFDLGMRWNPAGDLSVGVNLQDVTTTLLAWNTGKRELISPTLKTGIAYPFELPLLDSDLLFVSDADLRFEGRHFAAQTYVGDMSMDFHVGGEWSVRNLFSLRVGSDIGHFTAGAGIKLPRLDIDYAFLSHDEFDATHRISFRLRIEEEKFGRR